MSNPYAWALEGVWQLQPRSISISRRTKICSVGSETSGEAARYTPRLSDGSWVGCASYSPQPQKAWSSKPRPTGSVSRKDLVARLEAEGKSPGYIIGLLKAVRSWLRYNDIALMRGIKVSNRNATPTIENEQVPTQAELARILKTSPPRIRVAEALMAFADLRPKSIGNFDGTDGLTLKDFPELKIESGKVTFEKIPTMVVVRSSLSKTRGKYFTFLSHEGCGCLKEYLEERIRNGEKLTPETQSNF